ncbi:MAG: tRNA (N6-threonylcarbamoyladenosine(37)-N6)-methyltransferase TrmO [Firmicutes bacterium]|nr:tRNA (N6-threonylcarbamoyladenosine(37)-N6)-methyltransferase TrmO [Bacillota bacterium]
MKIIARIKNDYTGKFGIPRQSGMAENISRIVFEPEFRAPEALRGLSDYDYIWLIWDFSLAHRDEWSPTVRPPVLGGNERVGVFATRSPFRPNNLGLSSVRLISVVTEGPEAPFIEVEGADLMDGTPIFDIKPYIRADCHPEASRGFSKAGDSRGLELEFPEELLEKVPEDKRRPLSQILALDPRPSYQNDPERTYGLSYGGLEVRFKVCEKTLRVVSVEPAKG